MFWGNSETEKKEENDDAYDKGEEDDLFRIVRPSCKCLGLRTWSCVAGHIHTQNVKYALKLRIGVVRNGGRGLESGGEKEMASKGK